MKKQLTSAVLALVLSILTMFSPNTYADTTGLTSEASIEQIITEGYTRPSELKVSVSSKTVTPTPRQYDSRQFEIYYIDAWLFNDDDHDGFYSSFDLTFDLDVNYGSAAVYADIWIRPENGYYELLHSTNVFTIKGYGTHDEYHVSTDLIDDFPVGYYDILIELYDIEHSTIMPVATANSYSFDALYALPLESRNQRYHASAVGVNISASAGSLCFLLTPLGLLLALRLRRSHLSKSRGTHCNK